MIITSLRLGAFALSRSKRILTTFIHVVDEFKSIEVNYTDTDNLYNENKHSKHLNELGLVGKKFFSR